MYLYLAASNMIGPNRRLRLVHYTTLFVGIRKTSEIREKNWRQIGFSKKRLEPHYNDVHNFMHIRFI